MSEIQEIDINLIDQNKEQPRKYFDKDKLEALKKSINKDGLLQPIVVRSIQETGRYQIIAGERRYTALTELHRKTVPAIVLEADDKKALDLALLENEVRSDLTPLEKAEAIEEYKKRNNTTNEKIAEILGMTSSNISNITSLNRLVDETKKELRENPSNYPLRSLMTIARIEDPKKQRIAFSALKHRTKAKDEEKSNKSNDSDGQKKIVSLYQQAKRDLNKICQMKISKFEGIEVEVEELSQSLANILKTLFSSNLNALKIDQLKSTITEIASNLSAESATAKN